MRSRSPSCDRREQRIFKQWRIPANIFILRSKAKMYQNMPAFVQISDIVLEIHWKKSHFKHIFILYENTNCTHFLFRNFRNIFGTSCTCIYMVTDLMKYLYGSNVCVCMNVCACMRFWGLTTVLYYNGRPAGALSYI